MKVRNITIIIITFFVSYFCFLPTTNAIFKFQGGLWHLHIQVPPNYPLSPPTIRFKTRISHPNISFTTGEICLTLLTSEHWSPVYTISTTLSAIHQLLTDPRPDSPLNVDVAALLRDGDIAGWESIVRYWTGEERWQGANNTSVKPAAS
jgi:peroxin-4